MSVNPSHLASGVAQTTLQQSQVARAQDADRNRRARAAQRMRELREQQRESVEDSYETSDEHVRIEADTPHPDSPNRSHLPDDTQQSGIDLTA